MSLHQAGEYQTAIDAFDRSLERNSENIEARQARAQSYYRLGLQKYDAGDYPGAILRSTSQLLTIRRPWPHSLRGQTYYWMGDTEAAEKDYVQAAKLENRGLFWFCAACCDLTSEAGSSHLLMALNAGYDEASVLCNSAINVYNLEGLTKALASFHEPSSATLLINRPIWSELAFSATRKEKKNTAKNIGTWRSATLSAPKLGPPSYRLYEIGVTLHDLAIPDRPGSLDEAERLFRLMRACDDPQASYKSGNTFPRLLAARPYLADLAPEPGFKFVPLPPNGVLPPKCADLELIVGH